MWIFYASIVTSVVHLAAADDIAVTCGSCTGGGSELKGVLNGKLTVFYTIHATEFTLLKITYNGTNEMAISGLNRNVNTDKVTDRRLIVPNSITKHGTGDGATYTLNITLRKLRLADNGVTFTYSYTDSNVKTFTGETVVTVEADPTFCTPPEEKYEVEVANKLHIEFSLCANPKPTVTAKFGVHEMTVVDMKQTTAYKYNYKVQGELKREWCGDKLVVQAVGIKEISFTSDIILKFFPDKPKGVTAWRDDNNVLTVKWEKSVYGTCPVRYHVRYIKNGVNVGAYRTDMLTKTFSNATGNNSIEVNAEVYEMNGPYSDPILILPDIKPTKTSPVTNEGSSLSMEYIIAIVVVVTLIVIVIMGVCILKRKKGKMSENARYDVDMQPLASGTIQSEGEYVDVNTVVQSKPQEQQMIYAELGPGGGRTGQKPTIEESNYAQVKTEGVHYPDLQQSSQYQQQPPRYVASTRNKQPPRVSNDYDDESYDYESSVVV